MGVSYNSLLCYGIEFNYEDVCFLKEHPEFKKLAIEIGCCDMPNLWQEIGFVNGTRHYDDSEKNQYYIIGDLIIEDMILGDFLNSICQSKDYIQKMCLKYRLKYTEPKIMSRVNRF